MSTASPQPNPLVGIWKLVSVTAIHANGTVTPDLYGANPLGYITYTADGHMMVMFSRCDRPPLSRDIQSPLSQEMQAIPIGELAQAFTSFSAYAGSYTVEGDTVRHHLDIASIPNRVGTTLVRTFTVEGDRVTLRTPEVISDGVVTVFELIWERNPSSSVSLTC
ncbi:lipocalin-like domain-containing protein [Oscillatoria sp. FACHB-1407]|uniref:lipocalin-like domain-containing protein n=1 Tax=Oscillatoria sp. FACHB-1407 TaxID=2692847 RepID=UPI001687466B|nr:lipocalin-like domain-containing protein [Oscillatoria sp. FACHB-1407]MBD2459735.1 lipocalin-like domain-containing protein [Oscillatoria sp. FACHB-1407]